MIRFLLTSTCGLALIASASAADRSSTLSAERDSHIRVVAYSATRRTEIIGLVAQPTTITFPLGEQVYRVVKTTTVDPSAVAAAWKADDPEKTKDQPLGNNLTLWPLKDGTTIMNVMTIKPPCAAPDNLGSCVQKVYPFKLVAHADPSGKPDDPDAVFNVIFRGGASEPRPATIDGTPAATKVAAVDPVPVTSGTPAAPKKLTRAQRRAAAKANADELAADRLRTDSFNHAGGCHYEGQAPDGEADPIVPMCPMDNGIWTLMRFPGLSVKPVVYVGLCDGKNERRPDQHGVGDLIVIHEIAASFCLRMFPYAVNIFNKAFNPVGQPTNTDTISPGVQRRILQSQAK